MAIIGIGGTGYNQQTALILPAGGNLVTHDVTVVPEGSGLRLPDSVQVPSITFLRNSGQNSLIVYPVIGGTIDGLPSYTLFRDSMVAIWALSNIDWVTLSVNPTVFTPPSFTSFGISGQGTTLEVGATIAEGSKTFTWSTFNPTAINANSIAIDDTTESVNLATGLEDDSSEVISIDAITNILPASHVWTISGINKQNDAFSLTFTVVWLWRVYAGTSANLTLTGNQIKALADSNSLQAGFAGTYNFSSGNYKYFCYPDSMGSVSHFIDANTGFPISMATSVDDPAYSNTSNGWNYYLVSVTNVNGIATQYRTYRTQYPLGGALSVRIT